MIFGYEPFEVPEIPMRVVGANVPYEWLIYLIMWIPIGIFTYGAYKRLLVWLVAKGKLNRGDKLWARIWSLILYALGQAKVIKKPLAGWMHFFLFWGFFLLFMAAGADAAHFWLGFPHLEGNLYIGMSWIVDVTGFLAMIGIVVLAYIRYLQKPDRLNDTKSSDGNIILLIFVILFTGFIIEGARIAAQLKLATVAHEMAFERVASPFGWMFASLFANSSLETALLTHRYLWWFHMALAFLFIALVPYTKLWHIFTSMINYFTRLMGESELRMVHNIEEAESFGVEKLEEWTWKDLIDLDACIRCGRCQENCPAYLTGKHLNPKITLIQNLKAHMDAKAPYLLGDVPVHEGEAEMAMTSHGEGGEAATPVMEQSMIYDVVTTDVIWDCTNCRACMEHCPM
ncbi:MAG: 4Fe-4S dicluster domain-containing protein, partial [Syntrophomonadaceae bacterium]|nr:4Fe-4S dicluster domain-containing protein [Syntrophomonadaceae bacterium]